MVQRGGMELTPRACPSCPCPRPGASAHGPARECGSGGAIGFRGHEMMASRHASTRDECRSNKLALPSAALPTHTPRAVLAIHAHAPGGILVVAL